MFYVTKLYQVTSKDQSGSSDMMPKFTRYTQNKKYDLYLQMLLFLLT